MTEKQRKQSGHGLPERHVPQPGQPYDTPEAEGRPRPDPDAPPLGTHEGQAPGRDASGLSGGPSIAGRRGHEQAGQRGGASGELTRENRDAMPRSRDASTSRSDAVGNQSARDSEEAT